MTKQRGKIARLSSLRSALLSTHHKALPTRGTREGGKLFHSEPEGKRRTKRQGNRAGPQGASFDLPGEHRGTAPAPRGEPAGAGPPGEGRTSQAAERNAAGACASPSGQTPRGPRPPSGPDTILRRSRASVGLREGSQSPLTVKARVSNFQCNRRPGSLLSRTAPRPARQQARASASELQCESVRREGQATECCEVSQRPGPAHVVTQVTVHPATIPASSPATPLSLLRTSDSSYDSQSHPFKCKSPRATRTAESIQQLSGTLRIIQDGCPSCHVPAWSAPATPQGTFPTM